jgi:predicted enzyme related to lactoylglutathione lyase
MSNPVGWFEISVNDMARAKAFYEGVFGVKLTRIEGPGNEMWGFPSNMEGYGASGCLSLTQEPLVRGAGTLVYFSCTDCAVEAARAARQGGKLAQEKTSIGPYGHYALVIDSEGNCIGLHSMQ